MSPPLIVLLPGTDGTGVFFVNLDLPHMIFQSGAGSITPAHLLPFVKDGHAAL
ncbi:hypothetical protein ABAC460_13475 [Asticcacaulis sp. AC460]|uniref:hypothetical protein n=1 Tax=Asticcacaulis sp. AC460 TaxID=1282360 RepID=UPI0003C3DE15|nr:hypothetical protein [Asticcacaulis sp. AC460]ESQ89298.1 hypothetical protein ABAC460_13475 [Asticcacaulis sp. AC460]